MNDATADATAVTVAELCEQARKLPAKERKLLAEAILQSLEPSDSELDRQWAEEARSRIEAVERGEMALIDAEEVFARYDRT